jgi:hypothetical protein
MKHFTVVIYIGESTLLSLYNISEQVLSLLKCPMRQYSNSLSLKDSDVSLILT